MIKMNAKKSIVWLLLVCLLMASLSACANKNNSPDASQPTTDAPIDKTPVVIEDEGTDFWVANNAGFDNATEGTAIDFEIEITNNEVTILSYKGTNEHLIVPAAINGLPVTAIANGAFAPAEENEAESQDEGEEEQEPQFALKTLILPDSIVTLGTGILKGCESLHSLVVPLMGRTAEDKQYLGYLFGADTHENNARDIPVSLKCLRLTGQWSTLPAYALFDCNDLICLGLPEEMTVIEKFAIYNCKSLKQIDGLDQIVTFGDRSLMNCASLQTVTLGNSLQTVGFGAFEGCQAIRAMTLPFTGYSRTENTCLGYVFGAAQPDFAEGFYPKNLARVTLTEACQTLENYAFFECESLKEVILPKGLTSIGVRAFYGCISLWSIQLPDTLTTIRELAFAACDALSVVDFGNGVTEIGINAFYNCDSLTEITLPNTLKTIPASCFAGCISLESIHLGGVSEVGAQAFRHCNAVKNVTADQKVNFEKGNDAVESVLYPK